MRFKCIPSISNKLAFKIFIRIFFIFFAGKLFIADTNNSLIRYFDLNTKETELLTLELKGVQPPIAKSKTLKRLRRRSSADTQTVAVDGGSSNEGNLSIKISLPEEYHFSKVLVPLLISNHTSL